MNMVTRWWQGWILFLLSGYLQASNETPQCSLIMDTLTGEHLDVLYQDGLAISLEPPDKYLPLDCVPEYSGTYPINSYCLWYHNGEPDVDRTLNYPLDTYTHSGCRLSTFADIRLSVPTPSGNSRRNLTCESDLTGGYTRMTYLLYVRSKEQILIGLSPIVSNVTSPEPQVKEGQHINFTCEEDAPQATSRFYINWYLIDRSTGAKIDVRGLRNHSVSNCGRIASDDKKIGLTLFISNITKGMYNNHYQCVASKVDFYSPYNESLSTYTLHSALVSDTEPHNVVPKPTSYRFYENGTENACTFDKPCMADISVFLRPPKLFLTSVAVHIAISVTGGAAILVAVAIVILYIKWLPFSSYIKHKWAITNDVVDMNYKQQAVIFYAENSDMEIEHFAQETLLVKLENQWKYKIFVPQRDSLIGSTKAQECIDNLKHSQKAIFLLTEQLLAEEWKVYALDVALNKHRKIILVKMEDLNFQQLLEKYNKKFSEVESALKVSTVIDWTKDKYKWERLHRELPTIITSSLRHRMTYRLREFLKSMRPKPNSDKSSGEQKEFIVNA